MNSTTSSCVFSTDPRLQLGCALRNPAWTGNLFKPRVDSLYDFDSYPFNMICFMGLCWILQQASLVVLSKTMRRFDSFSIHKKRIVVTYVLELIITTVSLVCTVAFGHNLLLGNYDRMSASDVHSTTIGVTLIVMLYIWELTYRIDFGTPLLIHHVISIVLFQTLALSMEDTEDIIFARLGATLSFHASTEQLSFVALLAFRAGHRYSSTWFMLAAVQSFLFKTAITVISAGMYPRVLTSTSPSAWVDFWRIMFPVLTLGLFATQLYSVYIMYLLAVRSRYLRRRLQRQRKQRQLPHLDSISDSDDDKHTSISNRTFSTVPYSASRSSAAHNINGNGSAQRVLRVRPESIELTAPRVEVGDSRPQMTEKQPADAKHSSLHEPTISGSGSGTRSSSMMLPGAVGHHGRSQSESFESTLERPSVVPLQRAGTGLSSLSWRSLQDHAEAVGRSPAKFRDALDSFF